MTQPPEVVDTTGRQLRLGSLLGRGGEGAVYEIASVADVVAKVYHSPLSDVRAAKIRLMQSFANDAVKRLAAWPIGLLTLKGSGEPIGLLLPRVVGRKDIHHLYGPKSRRTEFPTADWRFLIRAAANTARAFAAVHSTGCVIGDVNEGSVLVAQDATVRLIDCDSFQVIANGRRYPCEVGVESFTPPELQGKTLRDVVRTTNHDSFGLAVMTFLLLFMGRHPFAGRFLGRGDMPIPKAIQESRFAYGSMRSTFQMEKPPGTPDLSIVGDEIAFLFERAFAKQMMAGGRPTAAEWVDGLTKLEKTLKQCQANPSHWHHLNSKCPWCPMEASTGAQLFPFVLLGQQAAPVDITTLWRQIESLPQLGDAPPITVKQPEPTPEALAVGRSYFRANVLALALAVFMGAIAVFGPLPAPAPVFILFGAFLAFFGARKWLDKSGDMYAFRTASEQASARWSSVAKQWELRAGSSAFDAKRAELVRLRDEFNTLDTTKAKKMDELRKSTRKLQLQHYLDTFEIARAAIDGIGNGRKKTLESYGIETAADLLTEIDIPGFGPVLRSNLDSWRQSLEARFKFDPSKGVDARDVMKIEQQILTERKRIEAALRTGHGELRHIHAQILSVRQHARPQVEAAYQQHLQAAANYKVANRT